MQKYEQNTFNNKSKGYYYDKIKDKWRPVLTIDGKRKYFGRYKIAKLIIIHEI
jgi:hypothetical protein